MKFPTASETYSTDLALKPVMCISITMHQLLYKFAEYRYVTNNNLDRTIQGHLLQKSQHSESIAQI